MERLSELTFWASHYTYDPASCPTNLGGLMSGRCNLGEQEIASAGPIFVGTNLGLC